MIFFHFFIRCYSATVTSISMEKTQPICQPLLASLLTSWSGSQLQWSPTCSFLQLAFIDITDVIGNSNT